MQLEHEQDNMCTPKKRIKKTFEISIRIRYNKSTACGVSA